MNPNLTGVLLLDKPLGLSSNQALQKAKRCYQAKKAGHTGSLDPLATGMLPICFGEATKFSQYLLDADKTYETTAKLGEKTTTSDAEGEVILTRAVPALKDTDIKRVLNDFLGRQLQVPSMYSALKHQGKPLYYYARQGIEIDRPAREIDVYSIDLLARTEDTLHLKIHCSKGTYIRNLVEDMGERLGCGAHVGALRRLKCANFSPKSMHTLDVLTVPLPALLPINSLLSHLPTVTLSDELIKRLRFGQGVEQLEGPEGQVCLQSEAGIFHGVGKILPNNAFKVQRLTAS